MDSEEKTEILYSIQSTLPSNWIVRFSKKHEDRVFFFNQDTGETTWKYPGSDQAISKKHVEKYLGKSSGVPGRILKRKHCKMSVDSNTAIKACPQSLNKNSNKLKFSMKQIPQLNKTSRHSDTVGSSTVATNLANPELKTKRKKKNPKRKSRHPENSAALTSKISRTNSSCDNSLPQTESVKSEKEDLTSLQRKLNTSDFCNKSQIHVLSQCHSPILQRETKFNSTVNQLNFPSCQNIDKDFTEDKFSVWTDPPLEKQVVLPSKIVKPDIEMLDVSLSEDSAKVSEGRECSNNGSAIVYVIVDTNIFLHADGLGDIDAIINWHPLPAGHFRRAVVVVPWIVLQELDHLKTNSKSATRARRAVAFLNRHFSSHKPGIRGQTIIEAASVIEGMNVEMNDDRILQCCFFFSHLPSNHKTVLFSKDNNLCNKAMINHFESFSFLPSLVKGITAACKSDVACFDVEQTKVIDCKKTDDFNNADARSVVGRKKNNENGEYSGSSGDFTSTSQELLRQALAEVLEFEMKQAYGEDMWLDIIFKKPPWSLLDSLHCIKKHWLAVFSMIGLDRLLLVHVESLLEYIKRQPNSRSPSKKRYNAYSSYRSREEFLSGSIQLVAGLARHNLTSSIKATLQKLRKLLDTKEEVKVEATLGTYKESPTQDSRKSSSYYGSDAMLDVEEFIETPDYSVSAESCLVFWQVLDKIWESIILHCVAIFKSLNFTSVNVVPVELQHQLNSETISEIPNPELSVQVIPLLMKLIESLLNALERFIQACKSQSGVPSLSECLDLLQTLWTITQAFTIETNLSSLKPVIVQHCSKSSEDQAKLFFGHQKLFSVAGVLKECSTHAFNYRASS